MAVPSAEKLEWYYPLKTLTADGQASPQRACEAGSDSSNLVNAALTQADDYWNGAIGRFDLDTPSALLRGIYFHVQDFVAAADKLVLSRPLPVAPATGGSPDTWRLFFGGNWRSTERIPGMKSAGLANITGVVIDRAGFKNGEGSGTLRFVDVSNDLSWQAPGDAAAGPSVNVGSDGTYTLFSTAGDKWLTLTVTAASLPASDQADTIALTFPDLNVVPDWEGYETSGSGKIRYHLLVIKNGDGANQMVDARAYTAPDSAGAPTTLVDGIGLLSTSGKVTSAEAWPRRSFWVLNTTKDDLRYVTHRSGNTLFYAPAGSGLRGKTAVSWAAGDAVEVHPDVDIGLDAPSAGQFESPANETTAPAGVTFSAPKTYAAGLALGTLAAGATYGIWVRETILEGHKSREDYSTLVLVEWV